MKVSELIEALIVLKRRHGDIEVRKSDRPAIRVTAPKVRYLTTSDLPRYWDSRFNRPESKGERVCVL